MIFIVYWVVCDMATTERCHGKRVECYSLKRDGGGFQPVWCFGGAGDRAIPGLIVDFSRVGFSLLLKNSYGCLPERAQLKFSMQPDGSLFSLSASLTSKWQREDFSIDSTLIGVLVQPDRMDDINTFKSLSLHVKNESVAYLRCTILPLASDSD